MFRTEELNTVHLAETTKLKEEKKLLEQRLEILETEVDKSNREASDSVSAMKVS